ncbi:MAG: 23S rRNA (uracil(1939)-C(5))-methyltransferase RlmD [Flavobacteriales bacterium]|nr:23S rRNA (uracil(1939)-C(5))-methyltransferase RlmD [Flavobacteriales bacterium]|tara:strand:+ start:554 stop:1951 length:1398 start_codon:yes stop_codon:yes gene_type:complete
MKNKIIEKVEIIDVAKKGMSIAKHNSLTIFIRGGVPGDICDIKIFKRRKKYFEGIITKLHKHSIHKCVPKCEHFGVCGGCKWQNIKYPSQLKFKEKEVFENLKRIGKLEDFKVQKIIESKDKFYYRNKMEFSYTQNRWLTQEEIDSKKDFLERRGCGLHIPSMFDKVLHINHCHLQKEPSNEIRNSIHEFSIQNNIEYYNIRKQTGLLRNLMIRTSSKKDIMVLVQFGMNDSNRIDSIMNFIKIKFPQITSLLYTINTKANNTIYDQNIICFYGKKYITESLENLNFKIGPKSFFQTNINQTKILYEKTREIADIQKTNIVYDLYTGTGTIAQFISKNAKKVIGIDTVREAINAAKKSTKDNKIKNCHFFHGEMRKILTETFLKENGRPNIIISDPPRDGMHPKVIEMLLKVNADKIVYISCNSSTQARDIELLNKSYKVRYIQPIDMFPQTHHVENIILLESII